MTHKRFSPAKTPTDLPVAIGELHGSCAYGKRHALNHHDLSSQSTVMKKATINRGSIPQWLVT